MSGMFGIGGAQSVGESLSTMGQYGQSMGSVYAQQASLEAQKLRKQMKKWGKYGKEIIEEARGLFGPVYQQYLKDVGGIRQYAGGGMLPFEREADAYSLGRMRSESKRQRDRVVQSLGDRLGRTGAVVQGLLGREDTYLPMLTQDYLKNMSIQRGLQRYEATMNLPQLTGGAGQLALGLGGLSQMPMSLAGQYSGLANQMQLGSLEGMLGLGGLGMQQYGIGKAAAGSK